MLLTAWLGWYYAQSGNRKRAVELVAWIEMQADAQGYLPEQVPVALNDPMMYQPWRDGWGEIARPLLWSHAKYLILSESVKKGANISEGNCLEVLADQIPIDKGTEAFIANNTVHMDGVVDGRPFMFVLRPLFMMANVALGFLFIRRNQHQHQRT